MLADRVRRFADRVAVGARVGGGWREMRYAELAASSLAGASDLVRRGVHRGERVAILSEESPEWASAFFAVVRAGGTVVPVDIRLTEPEHEMLLRDCAPHALLVSARYAERGRALAERLPDRCIVLGLEDGAGERLGARADHGGLRVRRREPDETAFVVYTSGTTAAPKGVAISFATLVFEVTRLGTAIRPDRAGTWLSVLPLSHSLEITGGFLGILAAGGTILYAKSLYPQDLVDAMRERHVGGVIGVPLLYKALQRGIVQRASEGAPSVRARFEAALRAARYVPGTALRRALFRPLHDALGGRLRTLISGGAPLDPDVERFFETIGLPILQGYGLTETGPVISVNTRMSRRRGSVGRPLPGVEVTIAPNGEILTRGPHLMQGYLGKPELTGAAIDSEGWFHTGDLGRIDRDGFLFIQGRSKNLIALADGQKVQPEEVEERLGQSPLVRDVCVLATRVTSGMRAGSDEVCAVIVPSDDALARAAEDGGSDAALEAALEAAIVREVERLGQALAAHKRPVRVVVCRDELPRTSTRKVRREGVAAWLAARERGR